MYENIDRKIDFDSKKSETALNLDLILKHRYKKRIQETDFTDVFSEEEVARDRQLVARLEEKFTEQLEHLPRAEAEQVKNGEKLSHILEIIIAEQGEEFHWAGKNAHFIRTSRFDDIVNGVDLIIEFDIDTSVSGENAPRRVALGVDASQNVDVIYQKIHRNIDKLTQQNGKQTPEVKYFQSAVNKNIKGPLEVVIPVVIGLEKNNSAALINLIGPLKNLDDLEKKYPHLKENIDLKRKDLTEKLKNHPAQVVFYRQISAQLKNYLKLLTGTDQRTKTHRSEIMSILNKFDRIKESKGSIDLRDFINDKIMTTIETFS